MEPCRQASAGVIASHRWCSGGPAEERYRSKRHGAGGRKWAENISYWPAGKPRDRALHGVKLTDHWPTTPIDGKTLAFSDVTASKFLSRRPSASQTVSLYAGLARGLPPWASNHWPRSLCRKSQSDRATQKAASCA